MFAQRFALQKALPERIEIILIFIYWKYNYKTKKIYVSMLVMMLYCEYKLIKNVLK